MPSFNVSKIYVELCLYYLTLVVFFVFYDITRCLREVFFLNGFELLDLRFLTIVMYGFFFGNGCLKLGYVIFVTFVAFSGFYSQHLYWVWISFKTLLGKTAFFN